MSLQVISLSGGSKELILKNYSIEKYFFRFVTT